MKMPLELSLKKALKFLTISLLCIYPIAVKAQVGTAPSANCHVSDGQFTTCSGGGSEWSDVQPLPFPASNSFLYVNQDAGRQFIFLLYDFPFQTTPIVPTDSAHVSFDTVEQDLILGARLEHYDIDLFGDGHIQVAVFGQPEDPGRIAGKVGFGASPNSAVPHLIVELQVPLTPGVPTTYSPDPIFWGAAPPAPPPPPPCPTDPGKSLNNCQKAGYRKAGQVFSYTAIILTVATGICAVATAGVCLSVPITIALIAGTGAYAAGGIYGFDKFSDPSDPNFTVITQPLVIPITAPLQADPATPQQVADAFNALFDNQAQQLALEKASNTALNRASGARDAGNTFWVQQQTQAAQQFIAQEAPLLDTQPHLLANLATALQAAGAQITFTTNDVRNFQASLAANGLPAAITQELNQLGVDSAGQAQVLQTLLSLDPETAAQLGVGRFPQMLADPTIADGLQQLSKTLNQAAPTVGNLIPFISTTVPGDYTASGAGLRGTTGGNITLSGIPAGATIQNAYLYWGMLDNGEEASLANLSFNGTPVLGTRIGRGPDTCWGRTDSFSYRADVTPLVTGNGTYSLTGVANSGFILAEGASLVVVYQLPGSPFRTVMLADGNVVLPAVSVSTGQATFSGFTATAPVSAKTTFMVGDGQATQFNLFTPTSFTGSLGPLNLPGLFPANNGPLWDTDTFDVSSVIGGGSSPGSAAIRFAGDCLLWTAQAFSVSSSKPAPVPATAAVVKATVDGHTAIDPRGLAPTDVPSITDRIAMIVQSRLIENPSISASDLTSQLVNSVPAAFLPPEGASNVIQEVLSQVVTPTPPTGDTTPPVISCGSPDGLWHANDVSIACTASDSGSGLNANSPANFTLTTSVPAGTETATTFTGTRLECDVAGNCATAGPIGPNMVDKKPPQITITAPAATNYVLNQPVASNYSCTDGGSGVATCAGPVASGSNFDTAAVGSKAFTVNASDAVSNTSAQSLNYNVGYGACLLYDTTRAAKSGSTIPIKFQLCDAAGNDVSSSAITVTALQVVMLSTNASSSVIAAGNANPDSNFRFDAELGPTGGYIFNLQTTGLATGTYVLKFAATGDPTTHTSELVFQVR